MNLSSEESSVDTQVTAHSQTCEGPLCTCFKVVCVGVGGGDAACMEYTPGDLLISDERQGA